MESDELKFILRLLGCTNYRSPLSASIFSSFKTNKNKICRSLGDRGLVDFSREIAGVKITPAGKTLLKMKPTELPIPDQEVKVLEAIAKASGKVAPSKITVSSLKAAERDIILESLKERGLIEVETAIKKQKAEVWITQQGQDYLRDDYVGKGNNPVLSLDLLTNYLRFLRKPSHVKADEISVQEHVSTTPLTSSVNKPTDDEIFQIIRELDRELATKNYLPIFHVRQKLQPPLLRDELDQAFYSLQRSKKIGLSTLAEPRNYTPEQVHAGIPQLAGGCLFFITVK
ncbi:transcription factor RcaD [Aetokthonos hydrillicola Thurmond2011]|jgi:predicted transcriptional regulator|uniref:Transcription factor RcaD n=1 Tax=Aetokthonos hydrillicola Thurmond2011 TaxID=2712845 RepID=A0AAP5M3M8_9CYAN|nr:transcription factor RcaD [Aetokthonos hydrillicola]MBO3458251.1 transcription factor RcaD [Aetokthonos hydrillicola CCALA 1050]MBW4586712.1 transcription factor RcaD [Aetokthonos hydrillicola CCALA 1050]MDR9893961.1 transcription factor RcaD [Aetokthonos hydrillicola Thurmond2011]